MEPKDARSLLLLADKGASSKGLPDGGVRTIVEAAVVVSNDGLDGLGSLFSMVVRDGVEDVMKHMGVVDVMENNVEDTPVTVNSGESTAEPVPLSVGVVGEDGVGVLEEGNEDKPVVGHKIRNKIVLEDVLGAPFVGGEVHKVEGSDEAEVGHEDKETFSLGEDGGVRPKVVHPGGTLVEVTGGVKEEVERPSNGESHDNVKETDGGRPEDRVVRGFLFVVGNKHFITSHVSGVGVVATVRNLPRPVRDEEEDVVNKETNSIANDDVVGETSVTTLVANNPHTGHNGTLNSPVGTPHDVASVRGIDSKDTILGDVVIEEAGSEEERSNDGGIDDEVSEGHEVVLLEAVLGNRTTEILDSEVGLIGGNALSRRNVENILGQDAGVAGTGSHG